MNTIKKLFVPVFAGGLLLASLSASYAVNTTFAQFNQKKSNKPFQWTNGGSGGTTNASSTLNADSPDFVSFKSDLWKFSDIFGQNLGWGISGAKSKFAYAGVLPAFLKNDTWDMSGTFGTDVTSVPEPGVVSLLA